MSLQHKRSSIAHKRPVATSLNDGQLALNLNATSPGVFFKNSSNVLTKVGPVHVGTSAPNSSPATGGSTGNSIGEQWLDTTGGTYVLKIWDGTAWRSESGTFVDVSGDTMTGALILPSGTEAAPALGVGSSDNGLYLPATDELGVSTNGSERLRIDSSGQVGIGTSSPDGTLHVHTATAGSVSANASADNLIVENSGAGGISILTPDASAGGLFFGSPSDNIGAALRWNHDNDQFQIGPDKSGAHLRLNSGDGVERMRIDSSGQVGIGTSSPGRTLDVNGVIRSSGTSAALAFGGNSSTPAEGVAIHRPANDEMAFVTNNTERLRIDSSGHVLIGSASDFADANCDELQVGGTGTANTGISIGSSTQGQIAFADSGDSRAGLIHYQHTDNSLRFMTNGAANERMRIDSDGNVGIGTSSPSERLYVDSGSDINVAVFRASSGSSAEVQLIAGADTTDRVRLRSDTSNNFMIFNGDSESVRVDSSGNVGIGETAPLGNLHVKSGDSGASSVGASADEFVIESSGHAGMTILSGTTSQGLINFADSGDVNIGNITYDHDSNFLFFRVNDSERMRITGSGSVYIGQSGASTPGFGNTTAGHSLRAGGDAFHSVSGAASGYFNRSTNDGVIVQFMQAGNAEGNISVSGSTVSYNGAHLSRWSQLEGNAERIEILRGSVLSNLDEMCEWGEEDNEQLNRMKISDVEGDVNVAGVFQAWDDDDDTYTNDFYCAMTGDFVIRIAQGTTVARGDLLMSAGDGTAKPQDDDIVRSKTIAKVTSTTVSTTYTDGSYCVPCVLMAC